MVFYTLQGILDFAVAPGPRSCRYAFLSPCLIYVANATGNLLRRSHSAAVLLLKHSNSEILLLL